ncbi:MAG: TIGR01777 family oxidoreductase [Pseudomonadota bacterium]|nr:TIGR01777 family oxidoreductase [Pseudomonadota bacterium]
MHIILAGGSGFLGSYLAKILSDQHDITILSRNPSQIDAKPRIKIAYWDGLDIHLSPQHKKVDAIVNLCGLSIARRWNKKNKEAIYKSRIQPSKALIKWSLEADKKPKTFIQLSGIDYYGIKNSQCTENDPCGNSFLADLAKDWEETTSALQKSSIRLVIARTAPVLSGTHPPLLPLIMATKAYLGATIGDGNQYFSWIHHQDFTNIMQKMLTDDTFKGIYNLCSPTPVTNTNLMQALAQVYKRPLWFSVPSWLLNNTLGEMSTLMTDSRKVYPQRLMNQGEKFIYPEINTALEQIANQTT